MKDVDFTGQKYLVLGMARTGYQVAKFLNQYGATVILNDQADLMQDPLALTLQDQGVELVGQGHPLELINQDLTAIVKNPGIPYHIPLLQAAMAANIPIITDVELFSLYQPGQLIGITGSNGKTTTTSLVSHILKGSDKASHLAGNIGIPALEVLPQVNKDDLVVMELSSFQLQGTKDFHPHIAAITNLYDAHLDYHGTRHDYFAAKLKIAANMTQDDYLIINADQDHLMDLVKDLPVTLIPFAREGVTDWVKSQGAYVDDQGYYYQGQLVLGHNQVHIPGKHNQENILVAIAIAKVLGIADSIIQTGVQTFMGVPYRIQPLGTYEGVQIYNDSKATNPTATITALDAFDEATYWIAGGLDRGIDFHELGGHLDKVKAAFVYGESKEKLAALLEHEKILVGQFDTLQAASQAAFEAVQAGTVLLFSPACASWDQFPNFEVRGDTFTQLVQAHYQA